VTWNSGESFFDSRQGQEIYIKRIQAGHGAHTPSYLRGDGGSLPGVEQPGREADHSAHLVARSRMSGALPSSPRMPSCLPQGQLNLYLFHIYLRQFSTRACSTRAYTHASYMYTKKYLWSVQRLSAFPCHYQLIH
jgi:hypothetical protein